MNQIFSKTLSNHVKTILELMSEVSEIVGYKTNIQIQELTYRIQRTNLKCNRKKIQFSVVKI